VTAHPAEPDEYDFTLKGRDEAVLTFTGVPITPFPFVRYRGSGPVAPATDWNQGRIYTLQEEPTVPNKEMANRSSTPGSCMSARISGRPRSSSSAAAARQTIS